MTVSIDVRIDAEDWGRDVASITTLCADAVEAARNASQGAPGMVDLLLTDDVEMQRLNNRWRNKDAPTDVLAFPAPEGMGDHLGDIAVGYGTSARDAAELRRPLSQHLAHLVIHGYLHLIGYDHIDDDDAAQMQAFEDLAMTRLGFEPPNGTGRELVK